MYCSYPRLGKVNRVRWFPPPARLIYQLLIYKQFDWATPAGMADKDIQTSASLHQSNQGSLLTWTNQITYLVIQLWPVLLQYVYSMNICTYIHWQRLIASGAHANQNTVRWLLSDIAARSPQISQQRGWGRVKWVLQGSGGRGGLGRPGEPSDGTSDCVLNIKTDLNRDHSCAMFIGVRIIQHSYLKPYGLQFPPQYL